MAYKQYQKIEKINEQRKKNQLKNTFGKNIEKQITNAVKNNDLSKVSSSQKIYNKVKKVTTKNKISTKTKYDITKKITKSGNVKIKNKEVQPCPYEDMTLVSQYNTIYSTLFNRVSSSSETVKKAITFDYFTGEARNMLSYAIKSLTDAKSAGINENRSKLNVVISQISNFAKASYYLGKEFKTNVTSLSNKMYNKIVSNTYPYYETSYWTSAYGDITCHLHKDSDAYKFLSSGTYKNAISVGKVTNVVMPIVADIMTGYIIYKKYISTSSTKFDNQNSTNKEYTYSKSVLEKREQDLYHDFPKLLDKEILSHPVLKRADGRCEFLARGSINGTEGVYHITTKGDLITHRVFLSEKRWASFATNYGLPDINNIPKLK